MEKIKMILILMICFFLGYSYECLAFSQEYSYNYEVTRFKMDSQNNVTISGWAILNAGVNDNSEGEAASPRVNDSLGSTVKKPYRYELFVEPIKYAISSEGKITYIAAGEKVSIDHMSATTPNLTEVLCYKPSGTSCSKERSAPYDRAGFSFSFNIASIFEELENVNGYLFWLNIQSTQNCTGGSWCNQTISLAIPKEAIDKDSTKFVETSTQMSIVDIVGNGFYLSDVNDTPWIKISARYFELCGVGFRKYSCANKKISHNGATLRSVKTGTPSSYNVTFYNPHKYLTVKYEGKRYKWYEGYYYVNGVSAVFVAPKKGSYTIFKPPTPSFIPTPFEDCTISNLSQAAQTKTANACDSNVIFEDTTAASCVTAESTKYYGVTCVEKDTVDFNSPSYAGKLKPGLGFSYSLKTTSELTCTGNFNYTLWKENYDKQKTNRDNYKNGSAKWVEFDNNLKKLESLYQNFLNYRGTSYDFNPTATVTLNYKESGNNKTSTVDMIVSKTETDSSGIEVKDETIDYSKAPDPFTHKYTTEKTFILPTTYYNYKTRLYENNTGADNVLLGNKLFLNKGIDIGNHSLSVTVSNLGYSGKWKATNSKCGIKVSEEEYFYRSYDETDPFLSTDTSRNTGKNWKGSSFDFTSMASKNTSGSNTKAQYTFELTTDDISKIRKDSQYDTSVYFGTLCTYNKNTTGYSCPIINNYKVG